MIDNNWSWGEDGVPTLSKLISGIVELFPPIYTLDSFNTGNKETEILSGGFNVKFSVKNGIYKCKILFDNMEFYYE